MRIILAVACACAAMVLAQESDKKPVTGTISGVVREIETGAPIAEAEVSADAAPKRATTDAEGRYVLRDVSPEKQTVRVRLSGAAGSMTRIINLVAGQELSGIDFRVPLRGKISGRVLDENNEPVPGITVFLINRAYYRSSMRSVYWSQAQTDDRGQYVIGGILTGQSFLVMAEKRLATISAVSNAPADRKLRKRVYARTFYPNSPSMDGAAPVVLRSGESREGVDIRILRTPSYCIDGVLTAQGAPAAMQFSIEPVQPSSGGIGRDGGGFAAPTSGVTGADGKIRVCDLAPDEYKLTAYLASKPDALPDTFSAAQVAITNEDVHNLRLTSRPWLPVTGEVVWDATAPQQPVTPKITILISPSTRSLLKGEQFSTESSIPGRFSFPSLFMDDYDVWTFLAPWDNLGAGLYVKDVTYAGVSVRRAPLRVGSALGSEVSLRVVLARDGGTISAHVTDRDGNPVNAYVLMLPAAAGSEIALADTQPVTIPQTDQTGTYTSDMLAPGKYYVLATETPIDQSPECIGKLWRARIKGKEVDLNPGGAIRVEVGVTALE